MFIETESTMIQVTNTVKCSCGSNHVSKHGKIHNQVVYKCSECEAMGAIQITSIITKVDENYMTEYGVVKADDTTE